MNRIASTLGVLTLLASVAPSRTHAQTSPDVPRSRDVAQPTPRPDASAEASTKLLEAVSQKVTSLNATGDRTSEAIADSDVTLALSAIPDPIKFRDLCLDSGDPLRTLLQSLADNLNLQGQVLNPACVGSGEGFDPFKFTFHLHYEGGNTGLFLERSSLLPIAVVSFADPSMHEEEEPQAHRSEDAAAGAPPDPPAALPKPDQPILLDSRHAQTSHVEMSLPPGWTPSDLPQPVHTDSPFATFDRTVTFTDGKLVTDQHLVLKKDKIDVVEVPAFQKWLESSGINEMETSIALASTQYFPESAFTGKTDDEKKAAELIHEAYQDIESNNLDKADIALKQAEALDPGHEILHENKGRLAAARKNYETALTEYQLELRAFPDVFIEMESIADAQRVLGRKDDAIATLQRWIAADPNSTFPVMQLMGLYHAMDRDDLAVAVGDQAMNTFNSNGRRSVRFLMFYGREQMLTGQFQAAKVTFETLLQYTTDIQFVNDAAYLLSEHGLSLDRAEETVRASLTQFDPENRYRRPHMYGADQKQLTSLMLSSWDTLGWILYNKKRLAEAGIYIRAAWRSHPDPAIGLHLGEILNAEDKPVEALDALKLALATIAPQAQEKAAKDPDVIAIHDEIARLEALGNKSTLTDPTATLAKLRVLDAGAAGKLHGQSKYTVSISASGITAFSAEEQLSEDAINLINAIKLPKDFFPPDSHAMMTEEATLNCTTTCSLTLTP